MKFTIKEFIDKSKRSGSTDSDLTQEVLRNASGLIEKINKLGYLPPKLFSSCLRSKKRQIEIYKAKGITDINKIPMKSSHLTGHAVDIEDRDGKLGRWLLANEDKLVELGLYCEDYNSTHNVTSGWVHLQDTPTKNRFFLP